MLGNHPPPPCPSNAYVQATLGVGSVNFCTVDFGGAFFNSFYCVPRVLPDTLVLRCTLFIFCAKAALLAKRAAACDKVEIRDNFDRWRIVNGLVAKLTSGNCPTRVPSLAQTIRSLQTWELQFMPKFLPKTSPTTCTQTSSKG